MTRMLADHGADVLKIESEDAPDPVRQLPPLDGELSCAFRALNRGKRSVSLDLKSDAGRSVFLELADRADAVVESFRPGVMDRLGLGYEILRRRNPKAILCSISGFGQRGGLSSRAGHDLGYLARAGVLSMSGSTEERDPVPGVQVADIAGGSLAGAFGLMSALYQRDRQGVGAHLDVSMTRSSMVTLVLALAEALEQPVASNGSHMLAGALPCYSIYRTSDGQRMALAALEPRFFSAFCNHVARPELASRGWSRGQEGAQVRRELERIFGSKTREQWIDSLRDVDCCCEPLMSPEEAVADSALGAKVEMEGRTQVLATDMGFGPQVATLESPVLGAHTREACNDWGVELDSAGGVG
ncbi:MAG: CoA transferase [Myxococcota bacterium]